MNHENKLERSLGPVMLPGPGYLTGIAQLIEFLFEPPAVSSSSSPFLRLLNS